MSNFLKQMIINRLKNLSHDELMTYSEAYGFSITAEEGKEIINYLHYSSLNPFKYNDRERMFYDLKQLTNEQTARQAKQLFERLIHHHEMEHLFED